METSASPRPLYRIVFWIGLVGLFGGIAAGIFQSLRFVGLPPGIDYQKIQDRLVERLEDEGDYAAVARQKRLAMKYKVPFVPIKSASPRDLAEMAVAWYEEGERTGDPFCYHRAALSFVEMQALLTINKQSDAVQTWQETGRRLESLPPVRSQRWSIANPHFLGQLAWTMATRPGSDEHDPVRAIKFAEMACSQTNYRDAELLDTLAVAYAAAGHFEEAVARAEKAIERVAATELDPQRRLDMEARLELYKKQQPYVQFGRRETAGY
ncbi:MAG: hypothetical protein DWQ31_01880 [Planctomycetota bacterium]|nr:MAG: hypothetical protein DWQ31_01880 [Planctomycetota bacterium]REJ92782.1 MAG: hypothetical protein DWQ35_11455 [Planctomycetota bacterium]REK23573.1 MAG: hypothetical protein DWQ42_15155 [Planctomycetota bacterium]REK44791.1 MAG: hypothetical protein DWQ46_08455 [Planctomycetota bacterium]